jgi:hypothetical protein
VTVLGKELKCKGNYGHDSELEFVLGDATPLGPLGNAYLAKLRLPGFPFEFPPINIDSTDRYLIFPAPDTLADYEVSARRCEIFRGSLVQLESSIEMAILACAIGTPSFVGGWNGDGHQQQIVAAPPRQQCLVLHPGGVLSITEENCKQSLGSICRIPKAPTLEGFQI